jgi:hypothetical protein
MRDPSSKRGGLGLVLGLCVVSISAGLGVPAAIAQDTRPMTGAAAKPQPQKPTPTANAIPSANGSNTAERARALYYVDFRARTAASYGHAFVWYGRTNQRAVEVAGLHPATESVIPYIVGHVLPVISETGASYGDLDPQYLTASYRVHMTEPEAKEVFAYIKRLQATSPLWNAATYNCVAFIQDIARHMGLQVPGNHLLYPEDWVNSLKKLNGGRRYMPSRSRTVEAAPRT